MAYVVTDNCKDCMFTDCVEVCPVDCFYVDENEKMLFINPDECIDCAACVPECPVEAIFAEEDVPHDKQDWIEKNRAATVDGNLEAITAKRDALPTAEAKKQQLGF